MDGRGSCRDGEGGVAAEESGAEDAEEVVDAAAAAAAAAGEFVEGAPFPDPGRGDDDDGEDDDGEDARAATRRWERAGERSWGAEAEEEVEAVVVEPAKMMLSAMQAAEEDAAADNAAGARSSWALFGTAPDPAWTGATMPLPF